MSKKYLLILCFMFFCSTLVWAIAPPNPYVYDVGISFSTDTDKRILQSDKPKPPKLPHYVITSPQFAPTTGSAKPLIILVEFQQKEHQVSHDRAYFQSLIFDASDLSMRTYYEENSGGVFTIANASSTVNPFSWIASTHTMEYYGADGNGGVDTGSLGTPVPIWKLAEEAVLKLDAAGFDFAPFDSDSDSDNIIDHVIIVHAGQGQENSGVPNDIWSHQWEINGGIGVVVDGKKVVNYTMQSEYSPLGIFCHEFGHDLGLPDLYNTDTGQTTVGFWCVMDAGSWLGSNTTYRNSAAHLCAWAKRFLGWGTQTEITEKINQDKVLYSSSEMQTVPHFYKVVIPGLSSEYFLLEYRRKSGTNLFDRALQEEGLLIWHIDDDKIQEKISGNAINTNINHLGVDLEEANKAPIEEGYDSVAANVFGLNSVFIPPQSNRYDGVASGITVANIRDIGTNALTLDVVIFASTNGQLVSSLFNYPNPFTKNTTIRMITSRVMEKGILRIFTISGEMVCEKNTDSITLRSDLSEDYKWVYEFLWDGKNNSGESVASGLYIYVLNADGVYKSGKIAIVR